MFKKVTFFAILLCLFTATPALSGAPTCQSVFKNRDKLISQTKQNWDVVQQCYGTCYFEATVAHLESILSRHYNEPVSLSRVHLFAQLIKERLYRDILSPQQRTDFISLGLVEDVMNIVKQQGILLLRKGRNSKAFNNHESLKQFELYSRIQELYKQSKSGEIRPEKLFHELDRLTQDASALIRKLKRIPGEMSKEVRLKIKDFHIHTLSDPQLALSQIRSTVDDNHSMVLYFNFRALDQINSQGFYKQSQLSLNANITTPHSGLHAVLVTGYRSNAKNEITHIILRNSWGTESGKNGYIYMPTHFLTPRFNRMEYTELSGLEIL